MILASQQKVEFSQQLPPVNMAVASVDNRIQVGGRHPWSEWCEASCSIWGSLTRGARASVPKAFTPLRGLTAICPGLSAAGPVPRDPAGCCLSWWVAQWAVPCAGAAQITRWVWWVTGNLGQGQCTPGLLAQGPSQSSLGAQGHGGEGEVFSLEFELQVAGSQGVVHLAGGLGGDAGPRASRRCRVGLGFHSGH